MIEDQNNLWHAQKCLKCKDVQYVTDYINDIPCFNCGSNIRAQIEHRIKNYDFDNITEFIKNKERKCQCPICGSNASLRGYNSILIICKFCNTQITQLNKGKVNVFRIETSQEYQFYYSIKMESNETKDYKKLRNLLGD